MWGLLNRATQHQTRHQRATLSFMHFVICFSHKGFQHYATVMKRALPTESVDYQSAEGWIVCSSSSSSSLLSSLSVCIVSHEREREREREFTFVPYCPNQTSHQQLIARGVREIDQHDGLDHTGENDVVDAHNDIHFFAFWQS
jgi:hypothetical protein